MRKAPPIKWSAQALNALAGGSSRERSLANNMTGRVCVGCWTCIVLKWCYGVCGFCCFFSYLGKVVLKILFFIKTNMRGCPENHAAMYSEK